MLPDQVERIARNHILNDIKCKNINDFGACGTSTPGENLGSRGAAVGLRTGPIQPVETMKNVIATHSCGFNMF